MQTIKSGESDMHAKSRFTQCRLHAIAAFLAATASTTAFAQSGEFTYVTGNVLVLQGGVTQIQARTGMKVNPSDIVVTGADGMAQLAMIDQAKLSLRSNSRLRIDRYARTPTETGAVLTLVKGTLRTFTTLLSGPARENYQMRTRVATVGIRGSGNILNQSDDDNVTTNHTIEGSHEVTAIEGNFAPIITNPNQTVQVVLGQAPKTIPTPPSLLDAGKTMVGTGTGGTTGPVGGSGGNQQPNNTGLPTGNAPVVGSNGLGFPIVDATGNLGVDPLNLQNIVIAANGTAFSEQAVPAQITLEAGALRGYTAYAGTQSGTSLAINGGSAADVQTITIGGATTIVLGRWANVNSVNFSGGAAFVAGGVHFGYGGSGFPAYLSDVLTGTVSYTRAGATTPTNQNGSAAQLATSILDVNFTARTLNATLGINMPAGGTTSAQTWTMQATNVPFSLNSFIAFTQGGRLVVTNGSGQSSESNGRLTGAIEGSFVGATLNGAIVGYGLVDQTGSASTSFQSISGTVAFQGPSQNAAAPFRDGLVSDPNGALAHASYIRSFATTNRPDEVTGGELGRLTAFTAPYVDGNRIVGHQNYAQGSSTITDNGFDADTGLVWGRWAGGSATIGGQSVSLANASLHYIFGATQTGPVSLPLTGTATYEVVGSTRPTDGAGHVGTFNSATLAANFSARTVDASINIGINGQTWNGAASGVPIYRDQYFSAYGGSSIAGVPRPASLNITCTPNCTPSLPTGSLDGFFTGRTGRGAGVMYNLHGTSGAVAFRRSGG